LLGGNLQIQLNRKGSPLRNTSLIMSALSLTELPRGSIDLRVGPEAAMASATTRAKVLSVLGDSEDEGELEEPRSRVDES